MSEEKENLLIDQPHKFVWSNPCNSYTLAAICEYCGLVAFYSNQIDTERKRLELAKQPCPLNPNIQNLREKKI